MTTHATPAVATPARPPRDELYRMLRPGIEVRAADPEGDEEEGRGLILSGHFARFDEWTEIDSFWEGRFMERIHPGAFRKTFREQEPKVLFNHGHDPTMGNRVLGPIEVLREDEEGAYYEVRLLDGIPDLIVEGLREGLYGASFRFRVVREELVQEPKPSDYNPAGIPERTIREAQVFEFGPVTFPAYDGATASARSITDSITLSRLAQAREPLARALATFPAGAEAEPHPGESRTDDPAPVADPVVEQETTAPPEDAPADEPRDDTGRRDIGTPHLGVTRRRVGHGLLPTIERE